MNEQIQNQVYEKYITPEIKQQIKELRALLSTKTNIDRNTINSLNDLQVLLLASYVYVKYAAQTIDQFEAQLKQQTTHNTDSKTKTEVLTSKMYSVSIGIMQENRNNVQLIVSEDFTHAIVIGLLTAASGGLLYACIAILDKLISIIQSPEFRQKVTTYSTYEVLFNIVEFVTSIVILVSWVYTIHAVIRDPDAFNIVAAMIQLIVQAVLGLKMLIKLNALSEYEARTVFVHHAREMVKNPSKVVKKLIDGIKDMKGNVQISKHELDIATRLG